MSLPQVVPDPAMPKRVTIYEVGPRDGLQNEQGVVSTQVKAEFVRRLAAAGLPVAAATRFGRRRGVPQLADAPELVARLLDERGDAAREKPDLVPNGHGLGRALDK